MSHRDPNTPKNAAPSFENFGNYILLKKLATGGMAEVFLARPASQKGNGRVQVIKRILPHVATDVQFIRMFQTEIQVCMGFNHPHTVQIHDFGDFNRQPYIAMEYIEGKNLKDVINKYTELGEMMPIPMVLSLMSQAAAGLSYAHTFVNKVTGQEVKAIHRDISPHNLLINYEGNLKVIDFGIAKAASSMSEATRAGTIKGKYAYLAPEQISTQNIDARADIFALGIVMWELLTLRRPFYRPGDSELTILTTITNCDFNVKAPSYYNGGIPKELDEIVLKALRKDPNERFATAEEFQSALRRVMKQFYPEYSYAENGKLMHSLFQKEMEQERNEIRMLNMNVQMSLSNADATVVTSDGGPAPSTALSVSPAQQLTPTMTNSMPHVDVDHRLKQIESAMKKKAETRHYLLFAFYLVSVIVLKIDDAVPLFEWLLPENRAAARAMAHTAEIAPVQAPTSMPVSAARNYIGNRSGATRTGTGVGVQTQQAPVIPAASRGANPVTVKPAPQRVQNGGYQAKAGIVSPSQRSQGNYQAPQHQRKPASVPAANKKAPVYRR